MDRRKRYFGPCATWVANEQQIAFNPSALVTNLLLFDTYIMDSSALREFPQLISTFGFESVMELLRSRCIKIKCDSNATGTLGTTNELFKAGKGFTYEFYAIQYVKHKEYISQRFKFLSENCSLSSKQSTKLKRAIADRIDTGSGQLLTNDSPEVKAARIFHQDICANAPIVKKAVALQLKEQCGIDITPADFSFWVHKVNADTVKVQTDIHRKMQLSEYQSHDIVQRAFLRVDGIYQQLAAMERYNAICGLNDKDLSLFQDKLEMVAKELNPEINNEQFRRVMEIKGFPDLEVLAQEGRLRLDKILEIRETKECQEFREWLTGLASVTDNEIRDHIGSLRTASGNFLARTPGRTLRWFVLSLIGILPPIGTIAGPVASLLDTFLIQKLFPTSGPVSFLTRSLPSAFELNEVEISS